MVKALAIFGVDMIKIHADGGFWMMKQVVDSVNELYKKYEKEYDELANDYSYPAEALKHSLMKKLASRPILLGDTILTSMNEGELRKEIGFNRTPMEEVVALAKLCKKAGLDGVVCLPEEVMAVKEACGDDFITVTPGIRFLDSKKDNQTRIATPACANLLGSDYIVVGRSITKADDVVEAYTHCKKNFTEEVTNEVEIANAKRYMEDLKSKTEKNDDWVIIEPIQGIHGGIQKRK